MVPIQPARTGPVLYSVREISSVLYPLGSVRRRERGVKADSGTLPPNTYELTYVGVSAAEDF